MLIPAVTEILKNIPIKMGTVEFETTTPTGAVYLSSNVDVFTSKLNFSIEKVAYGLGIKDFRETPNVLRVYLGELKEQPKRKRQHILEINIDDMNLELYEYLEELFLAKGALDVFHYEKRQTVYQVEHTGKGR